MPDQQVLEYDGLGEIHDVAKKLLIFGGGLRVWIFEGDLGAGKTTLIKALCASLKVVDNVSSPTFALVNEYENADGETIYHFDFYRIDKEQEAIEMGIEEYFDSGNYCFIEWPSKIPHLIPDPHLKINIETLTANKRKLVIIRNEEA